MGTLLGRPPDGEQLRCADLQEFSQPLLRLPSSISEVAQPTQTSLVVFPFDISVGT